MGTQLDVKYQQVKDLRDKHGVPFIYDGDDEVISINKKYFSDRTHLNENGAEIYTERIMKKILELGIIDEMGK